MCRCRTVFGLFALVCATGSLQAQNQYLYPQGYSYQQGYSYGYPANPAQAYNYPQYSYPQQGYTPQQNYYPQQNSYQGYNPYNRNYAATPAPAYSAPRSYNYAMPQVTAQPTAPRTPSAGQPMLTVLPEPAHSPSTMPFRPLPSRATSGSTAKPAPEKSSPETDLGPPAGDSKTPITETLPPPKARVAPQAAQPSSQLPMPGDFLITDPTNAFAAPGDCKEPHHDPCCDKDCPKDCRHGHWYGLAGFRFLQPRWSNPAFVTANIPAAGAVVTGSQDFTYQWNFTPQVELGYVGATGFGIRGGWWMFDQLNTQVSPTATFNGATGLAVASAAPLGVATILNPGETASAVSRLFMQVGNLDFTQDVWVGEALLKFGGGAQYAYMEQRYAFSTFSRNTLTGSLLGREFLNAIGPSVFLDGMRIFGQTGLGIYGRSRGSVLFTWDKFQDATQTTGGVVTAAATRRSETTIPVLELEGGVQYAQPVGRALVFLRAGCNGQAWFNAGNSSDSSPSLSATSLGVSYDPNANSGRTLTFLGLSVMAGIYY